MVGGSATDGAGLTQAFRWTADAGMQNLNTLLASAGVSQEIRGRLQSHGISGVQARHYDGHEYLEEKRMALETLVRLLEQRQVTNVTPIHKGKRA